MREEVLSELRKVIYKYFPNVDTGIRDAALNKLYTQLDEYKTKKECGNHILNLDCEGVYVKWD